jgi:hypothetical protein
VVNRNYEAYKRAYGKLPIFMAVDEYLDEKGVPHTSSKYGEASNEPHAGCKALVGPMSRKMWEEVVCPMMLEYARIYELDLVCSYMPEQEERLFGDVMAKLYFWHRLATLPQQDTEILYRAPEGKWVPFSATQKPTTGSADK